MSDINQENPNLNDENGDSQPVEGKKKLTDKQLRIVQVVAGVISAVALVLSMFIPSTLLEKKIIDQNSLINYLFVAVFVVIMFGRRRIETKYRLRLNLFSLTLIDGIVVGVLFYAVRILYSPTSTIPDVYRVLIIVGVSLAVLVLGVLVPYLRYRKRVAEGTLHPIRIPEPEPKEPSEEAGEEHAEETGQSSIELKVAAMLREMDNPSAVESTNTDNAKDDNSKDEN
jgi:Na+/proline symporter